MAKVSLAKSTPGLMGTDIFFRIYKLLPEEAKNLFKRSCQVFLQGGGYLPLFIKWTSEDNVLLYSCIQQPWLLSSISH